MRTQNNSIEICSLVVSFLGETRNYLANFLELVLPELEEDWWNKYVVSLLSYHQCRRLEQYNITTLGGLDLAGLLRVLDQNWFNLSTKLNLPHEARNYVKEMQTVRNKWAHADTNGFLDDDIYRDLDTIQRFATVICAEESFTVRIREAKISIVKNEDRTNCCKFNQGASVSTESPCNESEFKIGQIVKVRSNSTIRGAVIEVVPGKPEDRISVFLEGSIQTLYSSQLQVEDDKTENEKNLPCEQFHAYLTALQIQYPLLSTLYSLNAARVDFIPYQFRPVLRFIKADRPRLLIADGVGVGKTIEAGLIFRELQARRDVRSVLIICPRPLVTEKKWQKEMKRFEEHFNQLNGPTLCFCIDEMDKDGVWPENQQKIIVPYSLFDESLLYGSSPGGDGKRKRKRKIGLLDLDPPPRFDLVIVDEAHHIRNQNTSVHKGVKFFCDHADAVLFLTATPIQLGSNDLFVLLNTLRPDLIIDQESFAHMAGPNPFINQAVSEMRSHKSDWKALALKSLEQASSTPWGQSILCNNPDFIRVRKALLDGVISHEEHVRLISDTEAMHTFAGIINRTRRRDIDNFTVRKPETVDVPFTETQQIVHDELLRIQSVIFGKIHDGVNVKFMMTTIRRQAASCLFGLVPLLEEILNRHLDQISWVESDDSSIPDAEALIPVEDQIRDLIKAAALLDSKDPKLEALRNIIRNKHKLLNNKLMLFSSFRHTLNYLFQHLKKDGFRVGLIHGGTPDDERMALRERFEKSKDHEESLDLLLFSEIGCEGLDYQFCDCIVNYDIPWNPMRIEQRIGRIDRNGQKSESVAIINLITPGTVDADIYKRCLLRIGIFNNALGASEEILGDITREIKNIAENYVLSSDECKNKLQQLADNKIRLIQEQEELEQKQANLFGIQLPQEQMNREIADAASFWLSSLSIRRLVTIYLQKVCVKDQEYILGEKQLKTLRLSLESRSTLLRDFKLLPRQSTSVYREWENWLKGGSQHLPITFEAECAMLHPEAVFIMPLHPLVRQASLCFDLKQRIITNLEATTNVVPAGQYEFAIYQWRYHGIRDDLVLKPIASDSLVTAHLGRLLEDSVDCPVTMPESFDNKIVPAHALWTFSMKCPLFSHGSRHGVSQAHYV